MRFHFRSKMCGIINQQILQLYFHRPVVKRCIYIQQNKNKKATYQGLHISARQIRCTHSTHLGCRGSDESRRKPLTGVGARVKDIKGVRFVSLHHRVSKCQSIGHVTVKVFGLGSCNAADTK